MNYNSNQNHLKLIITNAVNCFMINFNSHSYKCFLRACMNFNFAFFHIFSGPLFANVEGYQYLDLLVWGLSPLTFLFLRGKFLIFFKNHGRGVRKTIFKGTIVISCIIFISYFFLNYSPLFNWNYFSRTFNIQVGFFIFDMLMRTFQLLVQVQEEQQPDKQCQSYCQFQHATLALSYFIVFWLSSILQINKRNTGPVIFGIGCSFSFLSIVLLPILYYRHHREQIVSYLSVYHDDQYDIESQQVQNQIEQQKQRHRQIQSSSQLFSQPKPIIRSVIGMLLINLSLIINTNYFSLWMMEPLGTTTQSSYQQYNITIQMVSGCFLLSSIGYYVAYKVFQLVKYAPLLVRVLLFCYGILLVLAYWIYEVNYVSLLILGFGFHQVSYMEFVYLNRYKWNFDLRFYLKNQVIAYFFMPIIFSILKIGQTSLRVYSLSSGVFLVLGTVLC